MADDTTALVNEADDTRDRIAATIDGLQDRLSPTAIVNRTVEQISASGSEAVASMKQNFGTHPGMFAAGGVAIGLAVLLHGRSSSNKTPEWGIDKEPALSDRPATHKRNPVSGRRGEPLVGAALSAVAGAVLAQIMPISPAERKMHEAIEDKLSGTAPSLQHRL